MKIIYYNPETKEIAMMAHKVLDDVQLPYIEITDEQVGWIRSSNMHVGLFFIEHGVLNRKKPLESAPVIKPILNYCYNIPLINNNPIDFLITQYKSSKHLHISLPNQSQTDISKTKQAIFIAACKNNDASYPLWYVNVDLSTLSENMSMVHHYNGTDDFRLYTYKIFNNYLHEQND